MSRPLRIEFPGALYHITSRGDRRENIYEDDQDRIQFLSTLANVIKQFNWTCFAYCLMDNHYHLLVQTPDANLSKGMRQLNGVYTQCYNRRHNVTGHLFQGRYKAIVVDEQAYLLELSRYIVLNPVKARMVKNPEKWRWSSYRTMLGLSKPVNWLAIDYILGQFAKRRHTAIQRYIEFVQAGKNNGPIWDKLNHQIYLGDEDFVDRMRSHLPDNASDIQIPKVQKRSIPKSLDIYQLQSIDRDSAIIAAYQSGGYSYQQLGDYFVLHFTTIGKIVRKFRE